MAMETLTMLQYVGLFAAYFFMTLFLPAFLFKPKFEDYPLSERLMVYVLIGNFFMMNLVYLLELLHIANSATLWFSTVLFSFVAFLRVREKKPIDVVYDIMDWYRRRFSGVIGNRLHRRNIGKTIGRAILVTLKWLREFLVKYAIEWLVLGTVLAFLLWLYGTTHFRSFGYAESDMLVHNYWINELSQNNLFAAGIYPMGQHCVLFYLHKMFGFETYTILRLFGLVQILYVSIMLYLFLRSTGRSAFFPYIGMLLYFGLDIWSYGSVSRFTSPLPQEFGMIFLLPCIFFLLKFFRVRADEVGKKGYGKKKPVKTVAVTLPESLQQSGFHLVVDEEDLIVPPEFDGLSKIAKAEAEEEQKKHRFRKWWKSNPLKMTYEKLLKFLHSDSPARWSLLLFAMGFSMTFAVHFYVTFAAIFACVGVAIACLGQIFHKEYFFPILKAGLLSIILAIYPMVICFAAGTPLQGSMGWGLNVIKGTVSDDATKEIEKDIYEGRLENATTTVWRDGELIGIDGVPVNGATEEDLQGLGVEVVEGNTPDGNGEAESGITGKITRFYDKIQTKVFTVADALERVTKEALVNGKYESFRLDILIYATILAAVLLSLLMRFRDWWYGECLFAMAVTVTLLYLLFAPGEIGIPALMDANRTRVFFVYMASTLFGLLPDAVLYLLVGSRRYSLILQWGSLAVLLLFTDAALQLDAFREPHITVSLESNGAVTALTNIIRENEDGHWTILSANDELRMGDDHGYHYETITFLREMADYAPDTEIYIPTEYVYVFVEKTPLDYTKSYEGSGQEISESGADGDMPLGDGLGVYMAENRWILMSKLYFWVNAYENLFPNEVKVYYEDDDFVCYVIKQNPQSLYNLAVDYGYNGSYEKRLEEMKKESEGS